MYTRFLWEVVSVEPQAEMVKGTRRQVALAQVAFPQSKHDLVVEMIRVQKDFIGIGIVKDMLDQFQG